MKNNKRFIHRFDKVIESIILPQFPEITDVYVENVFTMDDRTVYLVHYTTDKNIGNDREESLKIETRTLFKMLNPDPNESLQNIGIHLS